MSVVAGQQRTVLRLLQALRPFWRRDTAFPARVQRLLSGERSFGSRDRRLYREMIYTAVRYLPWIEPHLETAPDHAVKLTAWLAHGTRDTVRFRDEVAGDWPALPTLRERAAHLGADPRELLPDWVAEECPALLDGPELDAQLARAPLWLRLQTDDRAAVASEYAGLHWHWSESSLLSTAWRMNDDVDVTKSAAYARGLIEVQDLGSQLLLESVLHPGNAGSATWLDACAGAGGKTLQLAHRLGSGGRVHAHDVRADALAELEQRRRRAGFPNITVLRAGDTAALGSAYDGILVDAPCSGSGTWRRSPHLKWTTTRDTLRHKSAVQLQLLNAYAPRVRAGGMLVYATCSVARTENQAVVRSFLQTHKDFDALPPERTFGYPPAEPGLLLLPARHDTDGFYVCALQRRP